MSLTDEELSRLADIVRLQPTKNGELQDAWGLDSGSEVHQYLENHLKEYYYRDDDSLIRSTEGERPRRRRARDRGRRRRAKGAAPETIRVPELEARVFEVVAGPDERARSRSWPCSTRSARRSISTPTSTRCGARSGASNGRTSSRSSTGPCRRSGWPSSATDHRRNRRVARYLRIGRESVPQRNGTL